MIIVVMKDLGCTVDPVGIGVKSIIAALIANPEHNEHCRRHPDAQSRDVDKRIDKEYFKGFGIVDSKSTWKPNGIIKMIAKRKEKKYGTTILFDTEGILHEKWDAPMDSYTIVIADKNRICRALYKGRVPDDKVEEIIQLIIQLTKE